MASGIGKVRLFNTTPSKFTLAARRVFYSLRRIASSAVGLHGNHHAVCPATDMHGAGFQSEGPSMNEDIYLNFSRSSFVLCRNASVIAEKVNWEAAWPHGMSHRFDSETCWRKVGSGEDSRAASASPCVFCAPKHRCSDGDWKFASTTQTGPPPRAARIFAVRAQMEAHSKSASSPENTAIRCEPSGVTGKTHCTSFVPSS